MKKLIIGHIMMSSNGPELHDFIFGDIFWLYKCEKLILEYE